MPNEFFELEKAVAQLKADITILENTVVSLKEKDEILLSSITKAAEDLVSLRLNINDKFNTINSDIFSLNTNINRINSDINEVSQNLSRLSDRVYSKIDNLDEKIAKVSNNSLLEFTSDFDLKKILTLLVILFSIVVSPSVLTNYLSEDQGTLDAKQLEKLILLLEGDSDAP